MTRSKSLLVTALLVSAFSISAALFGASAVLAGHTPATNVTFNDSSTSVASGSEYAPGASYTFGIVIENETFGGDTIDNDTVEFQLGRPDGTFASNFTGSTTPAVTNSSSGVFNITFTQDQLGPAGDYNITWFAETTETDVKNSSSVISYTVAQNTSVGALLNLNGTFGDRTYESGDIAGQNAESNVTDLTVSIFNDLGGSTALAGSGTTTVNVTNDTTGISTGTFTVSANVTGNENYTASSLVSHTLTLGDTAKPTVSLSLSDSSISTRGSITVTCSSSDSGTGVSTEDVIFSKPDGNSITTSCGTTLSGDDTALPGTYTVEFISTDSAGNQKVATETFTATSGGGGSSGTGTVTEPQPRGTFVFQQLEAGTATVMTVKDPDVGVQEITVRVLNEANDVRITVTKLDGKPASITREIDGAVEKYLSIDTRNLPSDTVDTAEIRFSVSKQWLSENMVDRADVRLFRYVDDEWQQLDTSVTGDDSDEVFFTADTPGFSTFAVASTTPPREASLTVSDQEFTDSIVIDSLYLDEPGYVVVHADSNGSPGQVIGNSRLLDGEVTNLRVSIDESMATETVWPMLHYDDGDGTYEFPGDDLPVKDSEGNVLVKPVTFREGVEAGAPGEETGPVEAPSDGNGLTIFLILVVLAVAVLVYEKWDRIIQSIRGKGSFAPR